MQRQAADLDVDLHIEASPDLPDQVCLDPEKIAWAVATLVGNAFRYVRRGTRRMPGGSIVVKLEPGPDGHEVLITIQDDGPGIPQEKIPFLFRRAPGATHAAGLALMLIHDVVVAHGGEVAVLSNTGRLDHGTSITLKIPVRASAEDSAPSGRPAAAAPAAQSST